MTEMTKVRGRSARAKRTETSSFGAEQLEELSKAMGENALLQAKVNQALATHVVKLEKMVLQGQQNLNNAAQYLDNLIREASHSVNQLNDRVASNSAAWSRVAVATGNGLWLTRILDRFLMYLEMRDMSVSPYLVIDGRWEWAMTQEFIERLRPEMTVVDVGANYGYYTLLAASYVFEKGRVHAFEPNPRTYEILMKNIHVNWFTRAVQAHPLAVLDAKKQVELHVLREFQGGTSLFGPDLVPEADPPPEQRATVDAVRLDEVVTEKVDLMKIDAEGSEPLVYEGMRGILERSPRLIIFMEFCPPMLRHTVEPQEFLNRIRGDGFTLKWFTPWGTLEPFAEEKAMEYPMFNLLMERS